MTTLTPFRLFQICKYAVQQYTPYSSFFLRRSGTGSSSTSVSSSSTSSINSSSASFNDGNAGEDHIEGSRDDVRRARKRGLDGMTEGYEVGFQGEERRGWDVKPRSMAGVEVGAEEREGQAMRTGAYELRLPGLGEDEGKGKLFSGERSGWGNDRYTLNTGMSSGSSSSSLNPSSRSSSTPTPSSSPSPSTPPSDPSQTFRTDIARLMAHPALFTPHFTPPKNVIVLCHGLYGFSTATPIPLFPSLKLHYWHSVLSVLRERLGCKVMVVGVKGTGSIEERAGEMDRWLKEKLPKGTGVNFVAHSMGGLDCRYLITHLKPTTYTPLSLTMIGTPNRGSPFMDWCAANIGVGVPSMTKAAIKAATSGKLPPYSLKSPLLSRAMGDMSGSSSKSPAQRQQEAREDAAAAAKESSSLLAFPSMFGSTITNYLLGILDHPAYGNLTTHHLNETFNPSTPDDPNVKYLSVAGRTNKMSVLHPLWFPKLILDAAAERGYAEEEGKSGKDYEGNDGLVSVSSAKWGEWLGTVDNTHHWDLRGEGGLLPNGPSLEDKPEGRPDPDAPGGWDWDYKGDHATVKKIKDGSKEAIGASTSSGKQEKAGEAWLNKQAIEKLPEMVKKAAGVTTGWDMSQVGQVIDWVGDLMPGTGPNDKGGDQEAVGARQLADAAKEKAREGRSPRQQTEGGETGRQRLGSFVASEAGMRQTGEMGKRDEKRSERTAGKFDLGNFYGGIAVKLSEEGY